ncbi:MAG: acylneuraminate cytidylyltransferase family protein [Chloroflexi bacterium]|nr:acylneuraminate cytidylyltransferase family protein [Chloroflexota bacterium]
MTKPNVVGIVPARGGSKGIPRKNIRPLLGKPLIHYTLSAALRCKALDRVVVSTEDEEIARIAKACGAEVVARPGELAQDDTPSIPVFRHVVEHLKREEGYLADIIVVLQPTSPLRKAEDIEAGIRKYQGNPCDSVISVCPVEHPPQWMYRLEGDRMVALLGEDKRVLRRQDAPTVYRLNGAVYVVGRDWLMAKDWLIGDNSLAFVMAPERSLDIDTEMDLVIAEAFLRGRPG